MKHFAYLLPVCCLLFAACRKDSPATEIIPTPRSVKAGQGTFDLGGGIRIAPADPLLRPAADYLAQLLREEDVAAAQDAGNANLSLELDPRLPQQGYTLKITPARIELRGGSCEGVVSAAASLRQLLWSGKGSLPALEIDDAPRFAWRGFMLDVARHFFTKEEVMSLTDRLACYKFNRLHLHLTDDQGWRIEIKRYPLLTRRGAWRTPNKHDSVCLRRAADERAPKFLLPAKNIRRAQGEIRYGGYYTQDDIREIVAYAAQRGIEVIPEIDLPGHSRNIASVHPEIRCNYPPDTVSTNGYDYRSAWCVAREENYALLGDILGELCELFPSEYIHVGGDEVDMSQWERCPDCRALMKREGMTDPHRLEDLFMERMAAILRSHGKRPAVWNEAVRTGAFARECRVHGWESVKACLDATAKGYRTVVMPGQYFYFDMRQSPREDGHDWAAIFDAKKVYGFGFTEFSPEQMRNVEGLQGAFFSEAYVSHEPEKPDYLDYMLFPRVCALARIAWSGNAEGWDAYYEELKGKHYDRMAAMGIRFRLFPPKVGYGDGAFTASADDGSAIYYLMDGSPEEHPYTAPVRTGKPHLYRFYSRYGTARSPYVADKSRWRTITPAVAITTSMGESAKFPYANAESYKGLSRTRRACRQQDWIRYTFSEPVRCREMYLQTGNRQLPKTIVTTGYAEVSYDGATFERAGELEMGSITLRPGRPVKAVRIVSTCDDNGTPYVTIQPPQVKPAL